MTVRFRKKGERRRHFIGEWRRYRDLTQEQLADRLETTKQTVSRIENGVQPYGQDFLEACADALGCEPADLIMRNPEEPEGLWSIWQGIAPSQRDLALAVLRAVRDQHGPGVGGSARGKPLRTGTAG